MHVIIHIVNRLHIRNRMTIFMIMHVRVHVRLIVAQIERCRTRIVAWIVVPMIWRMPYDVVRTAEIAVHWRSLHKYRLNDVVRTVDILRTNHLAVWRIVAHLHYYGSHILEDISRQNSLDHQHMVVAVAHLHYAEVIHPTIVVQVQIGDHIAGRVEDTLKLLNGVGLRKRSTHSLQIQIEADILGGGIHLHLGGGVMRRRCFHHRGRGGWFGIHHLSRLSNHNWRWSRCCGLHGSGCQQRRQAA